MSVLPFPSFLDDIKEKGVRKAVFELVDETVERITAGMNVQDIREALRGEAPSRRPNPRLTPHADAFWMHMRPSYYHQAVTGIYPTLRLGFLSTFTFVIEIITGLFLMIFYTPSPADAYPNMITILSNVPLGQFMRDMHRLGAEAMVLFVALHTIRTFATGSYRRPRQFTWMTGMLLLFFTLFLSFTGYLLPWDQLAFWAVTIGTSMAEAAPPEIVGTNINLLLRGAPDIGAGGLLRFYLLHVFLLPAITTIFIGVHYYKVVLHGHSLPPRLEEVGQDTAKRVPMEKRVYFIPDVATTEMLWFGLTIFIMTIMCIWFFHAPLETHANPQVTPLHTTAPWYFLWLQGLLKLGDKIFFGLVIPGLLLATFIVYPYLDVGRSRRYAHRRFQLGMMLVFIWVMLFLTYFGTGKWGVESAGDQEMIQAIAPMEGVGPVRAFPYEEWVNGTYCTDNLDADHQLPLVMWGQPPRVSDPLPNVSQPVMCQRVPDGPMRGLMESFVHEKDRWGGDLPNVVGILTVSDAQTDLKRIDMRVIWNAPEVDENRRPIRDANGNMQIRMVESLYNDQGQQELDDQGLPIKHMVPGLLTSGKTLYISRLSDYQGGGH
jgi:quinol-cytochrome oxidoreductase complex cytochrome b subunit